MGTDKKGWQFFSVLEEICPAILAAECLIAVRFLPEKEYFNRSHTAPFVLWVIERLVQCCKVMERNKLHIIFLFLKKMNKKF